MISVERSAGIGGTPRSGGAGEGRSGARRQVVIMPEGTRKAPDDPPDYKPGAAALYGALDVPCVPFGLNAGVFWPRRTSSCACRHHRDRVPATHSPGLPRMQFQAELEQRIETSTGSLWRRLEMVSLDNC